MSNKWKDYSLVGNQTAQAVESGLAGADWYQCPVPRKEMKALMKRKDGPAIRDTLIWFSLLGIFGYLMVQTWQSIWFIPAFLIYSLFYGSCGDSRWHECAHGTAFKTRWMNTALYHFASFLVFRNGVLWKWSHARHHTDTIVVGRDPEIAVSRPTSLWFLVIQWFYLADAKSQLGRMLRLAFVGLNAEERDFVPESERGKVVFESRLQLLILISVIVFALYYQSWLPLFFVGLPTLFGAWADVVLFGWTQHAGLAEDVVDHRQNCRTVYMNPLFRFIYWNMNYHLEHHMFPLVPYHALPKLHELIREDTPPAYKGLFQAWREILPALIKQQSDPSYFVQRPLPDTARPYKESPAVHH